MEISIIGGGISGLALAWHLQQLGNTNYNIFEAAPKAGGLCASYQTGGFTFDYSGHLLHLATPHGLKMAEALLGKNILAHKRKAFVITHGSQVPFPFQNNLYGLPEATVSRCVNSALTTYKENKIQQDGSFVNWSTALYGQEICDIFMFPYNTKLWQVPLDQLTNDWCGKFVPQSSLADIIKGAYSRRRKDFGYNSTFLYPKTGGCQALCDAIASRVNKLQLNSTVSAIDSKGKTITVNGTKQAYDTLVSTMPLKQLGAILSPLPTTIRKNFEALKHNTIKVLNIAAEGKTKDAHWFYFPEVQYSFYRIGVQSAFAPSNAPKNTCSFYVELPNIALDEPQIIAQMRQLGFIEQNAKILFSKIITIPCAYPIYDKEYKTALNNIIDYLHKQNIYLLGRYGAWEYSFMEKSLLDAELLARTFTNGARK